MLAENVQSWIHEWITEGKTEGRTEGRTEGEALTIVRMAEIGRMDVKVAKEEIAPLRLQLQNEDFWLEIDQRLEKL